MFPGILSDGFFILKIVRCFKASRENDLWVVLKGFLRFSIRYSQTFNQSPHINEVIILSISSVSDPDQVLYSVQVGKNDPKRRKKLEIWCVKVLDVLFWGWLLLLQFLWRPKKKNCIFSKKFEYIYNCKIFYFFIIKSLDSDPDSRFPIKIQNSDPKHCFWVLQCSCWYLRGGARQEILSHPGQAGHVAWSDRHIFQRACVADKKSLRQKEIDSISCENKNERSSPSSNRAPQDK